MLLLFDSSYRAFNRDKCQRAYNIVQGSRKSVIFYFENLKRRVVFANKAYNLRIRHKRNSRTQRVKSQVKRNKRVLWTVTHSPWLMEIKKLVMCFLSIITSEIINLSSS